MKENLYISYVRNIDALLKHYPSASGQVFLWDFPCFVSFSRINAYLCIGLLLLEALHGKSKGGKHIHKKA